MKRFFVFFLVVFAVAGCQTSPEHREFGAIPTEVTWNNHMYKVTGDMVKQVGKKLGAAQTNLGERNYRDIYQIPGKDSSKEVAISQLSNTFFRAISE